MFSLTVPPDGDAAKEWGTPWCGINTEGALSVKDVTDLFLHKDHHVFVKQKLSFKKFTQTHTRMRSLMLNSLCFSSKLFTHTPSQVSIRNRFHLSNMANINLDKQRPQVGFLKAMFSDPFYFIYPDYILHLALCLFTSLCVYNNPSTF